MDIWLLKERQSHTWIFKNILRLWDLVVNWIRIIPGNESRCKFWTSPWSPFGQLISYLGNSGPRTTGIPITATLASLWINNSWALPSARSNKMEEVLTHLTTISLSPCPDIAIWDTSGSALINLNGDRHMRFLITLAWHASIYELWRERNNRLHQKFYRSSSAILSSIKAVIKNKISSFRDINGGFSSTTMQLWFASV
ncbi:unnamed protein product [Brassica napus]|uniref:(rape) hypothetical protein n=1 Tax=Brassica napus TaxID=3708 RepID=A0A816RJ34_BRANA|nr:unnamed protein product [Brassica napus]